VKEQSLFDALVSVIAGQKQEPVKTITGMGDTEFATIEARESKRTPISDLRILVAEDHPFNRKLCQLMLETFHCRADWAVNGREAVEQFKRAGCDAVLMDLHMPEMDGLEATAAIRRIENETGVTRRVRIVAVTANALAGERERCLAAGMDDYVTKPFTRQQLYNALLAAVQPPSAPPDPTFDASRVERLCDELDRASVVEMTGDLLRDLPGRLEELNHFHAEKQWKELERAAHTMKGVCALFGLQLLVEKFLAIEETAKDGDPAPVQKAFDGLAERAESAAGQLRQWLEQQREKSAK